MWQRSHKYKGSLAGCTGRKGLASGVVNKRSDPRAPLLLQPWRQSVGTGAAMRTVDTVPAWIDGIRMGGARSEGQRAGGQELGTSLHFEPPTWMALAVSTDALAAPVALVETKLHTHFLRE